MEFPKPIQGQFTIYSKSGCSNCSKVKTFLKDNNITFTIINCDEFILENKEEFLLFIKELIGKEYRTFPMVFDNSKFIGGFNESIKYIGSLQDTLLDFDLLF